MCAEKMAKPCRGRRASLTCAGRSTVAASALSERQPLLPQCPTTEDSVYHHPLHPDLRGSELEDGTRSPQVGTDSNPSMCAEKTVEP